MTTFVPQKDSKIEKPLTHTGSISDVYPHIFSPPI